MNEYKNMTDEEIIAGGVSYDDSGRITELVARYTDHILHRARSFEGDADIHELISEGVQALLRAVSTYDANADVKFSSYAGVCISNAMKNVVQKAKSSKKKFTDLSDEEFSLIPDPSPTMEELMVLREETDDVYYHITHSLTELEKHCMNGVILGLSYEEMAKQLGIDKKSVDNAVTRARAKLRRLCNGSADTADNL